MRLLSNEDGLMGKGYKGNNSMEKKYVMRSHPPATQATLAF
jgi:hypothetical protein